MKKKLTLLALLITTPLLTQCASQDRVNRLEYQLRLVNKKLQQIENNTVNQIQKRQAASFGQLDQLQSEILGLKSELEETHHLNRRLKEQNKELEGQFKSYVQMESHKREEELLRIQKEQEKKEQALAELNEKLRVQQANLRAIQQARVRDAERRAIAAKKAAELAKNRTSALSKQKVLNIRATKTKIKHDIPLTAPKTTATVSSSTTKPAQKAQAANKPDNTNVLTKADRLYQKGDYTGAYKLYESHASKSSDKDSMISARYMMGECLFNQKQYNQAVLQYQKIISIDSDHPKAPAALLRQAEAFEKMNDNDTAKLIYTKLISTHGDSEEASKAQAKLDQFK